MTRSSLVLVVIVAAACSSVGPDYQRPANELPAAYEEAGAAAGTAIALPTQWWTLYGDATLDELVRSGLARNSDVRQAAARVEEAEALLREVQGTLTPQVDGQAGVSRSRTRRNGTGTTISLGVSTSFEIDLWGRLSRAERAIREQLLATRHGRDTVALTLAASIARAYFATRSLDSQTVASNEILRAADESLAIARKRADAGITSALDVYQAGSLRAAAAAQAKEIARQRAVVVHQLRTLTGDVSLTLPASELTALPIPPMPPAGLPSDLLQRRPDVAQAEATLAAATERIGVARAAQFPTLRLTASLGKESPELDSLFSSNSSVWSLGANLLGPIIDAGRYAARTQQAEAQARQAAAAYRRTLENAFRDVSDGLSNVRLAADIEDDLQSRVEQARSALGLARRRYDAGYSAYLEVLDAQRTLNDALLAFIRNRQAYLSYTVDLINALGGGWQGS